MVSREKIIYFIVEVGVSLDIFVEKFVNHYEQNAMVYKGLVFWYRIKTKVYGAIVLDVQPDNYYLIAISEECESIPNTVDYVLKQKFYTAAWFSSVDLLPARQLHTVGHIKISGSFHGRAGFLCSPKETVITNCGQRDTWRHTFRAYAVADRTIADMLLPTAFRKVYLRS